MVVGLGQAWRHGQFRNEVAHSVSRGVGIRTVSDGSFTTARVRENHVIIISQSNGKVRLISPYYMFILFRT